ncbi:cuticlin-1 [Ditylenchus destructor]|uniref:Cuticlin-1 n=1 Tax=Ditylenchus destructor TaxID=166010 RepID=A0AAD4R6R7_9BILA|nr:cuticlin-1 [Ditylenchus destructor]
MWVFWELKPLGDRLDVVAPPCGTLVGIVLPLFLHAVHSISIDNDIIGEPDIECLDHEIRVWVKTRKFFAGRIYAKGKSEDPDCSKDDFAAKRTKKPQFDLPLGMCGMKSLRSFDPRGMYYGVTLVISFHPLFITKVDQAFHVKCFFEEASRGLTAELGVSMIATTEVEARHGIPGCTYSIHKSSIEDLDAGRPAGTPIQFAKVGDKVLHQWHCDDQMFGILINNCYVTDGVSKKAPVIDAQGCPVDPILITGIRYSNDLQRAYAESQVFKFADRPGVWFFCQIQMCMKSHGMCEGITPPGCATGGGRTIGGAGRPRGGSRGRIGNRISSGETEERETGGEGNESTGGPPSGDYETEATTLGSFGGQGGLRGRTSTINPNNDYDPPNGGAADNSNKEIGESGDENTAEDGTDNQERASNKEESNDKDDNESRPEYTTTSRPKSKVKSKAKGRTGNRVTSEETDEASNNRNGDSEEPGPNRSTPKHREDNDKTSSNPYAPVHSPSAIENENNQDEQYSENTSDSNKAVTTVFGPAFSPELTAGGYGDAHRKIFEAARKEEEANTDKTYDIAGAGQPRRSHEITTEFETHDDLRGPAGPPGIKSKTSTPPTLVTSTIKGVSSSTDSSTGTKKDYVDYDSDVTIPPNLTDLLANLQPQDINADNLQKMFRDSVADRRALLQSFDLLINKMKKDKTRRPTGPPSSAPANKQSAKNDANIRLIPGEKIDTMHVSWDSHRLARDSPLSKSANPEHLISTSSPTLQHVSTIGNEPPMIAGQLLIYDLDETPPPPSSNAQDGTSQKTSETCAVTRQGLVLLAMSMGSVSAALFIATMALYVKLRHSQMNMTKVSNAVQRDSSLHSELSTTYSSPASSSSSSRESISGLLAHASKTSRQQQVHYRGGGQTNNQSIKHVAFASATHLPNSMDSNVPSPRISHYRNKRIRVDFWLPAGPTCHSTPPACRVVVGLEAVEHGSRVGPTAGMRFWTLHKGKGGLSSV